MPGWFVMYMPIRVPYGKIFAEAEKAGFKPKRTSKLGIIEKGAPLGRGYIAIEIEPTKKADKRLFNLEGEYLALEHIGPYNKIGETFKKITTDHAGIEEFYSCYLNSPNEVSSDKLRTLILFK